MARPVIYHRFKRFVFPHQQERIFCNRMLGAFGIFCRGRRKPSSFYSGKVTVWFHGLKQDCFSNKSGL